jgi:hypothetical protein
VSAEILDKESQKIFADYHQKIRVIQGQIKDDRVAGEAALRRLLPIAQGNCGQSVKVARILLGLYNGHRFPLDLTNLRSLDYPIMEDVMAVLRMDANAYQEVHRYFDHGGLIFEKLADDWGMNKEGGAA